MDDLTLLAEVRAEYDQALTELDQVIALVAENTQEGSARDPDPGTPGGRAPRPVPRVARPVRRPHRADPGHRALRGGEPRRGPRDPGVHHR
jgi:hypothetical protein